MDELGNIRNIGIIAHIDAGKTTVTEGMLYYSGRTHRFGNIDEGTTVMDFLPEERARGITIVAAAASLPWEGSLIHLIDTPGHIDFTAEVERSLRVIDGAVVIFSGVEGVEAQSEKVWRQADHYSVAKIAFVNKLDRIGASFPQTIEQINETFGNCALAIQYPVGIEDEFSALVDLVTFELLRFSGEGNHVVERLPVPDDLAEAMAVEREALLERLADESDDIAMLYLEGEEIPVEMLQATIRALVLDNRLVPVFCGSAKKSIGVQPLMDAAIAYLPSPADRGDIPVHTLKKNEQKLLHPDSTAPFAGLIFKVIANPSADLFYVRTYSGTLRSNSMLLNTRTGEKIRVKQILRLYAKSCEAIAKVGPGDIVGVIGPRNCGTGDTLCEPRHQVAFEEITFPESVISVAVEPRYSKDKDRLDELLEMICREDPTLHRTQDEETGQRILSGMGELHLEISLKRLTQDLNLEVRAGEPRVAYRETLKSETTQRSTFQKTLGENELFAQVEIAFRPVSRSDEMFSVSNAIRDVSGLPKNLVAAAERALNEGLRTGGNHGYPLIYLSAELRELVIHPERTTEGAVVGAVLMAIDEAIRAVGTTLLEPLMHLEIMARDDTVGEISMYLQPRRAIIHSMASVGEAKRISCEVPLAEMFGFGKALPKLSGGRATFSMEPCGYQPIPTDVAERIFGLR